MATRKVRVKKLNPKQPLDVLTEDEIDATEYHSLVQELSIATGVEQGEENEYHLQQLLRTTGSKADNEIPVPPPQESDINYDELYSRRYQDPVTYIRSSQTVEECIGCMYDMTEEDDEFLKVYNAKRPPAQQLSEDDFEGVMEVFEETASFSTPFAAVDKSIAPYSEMVPGLNNLDAAKVMPHAKELYEYWKQRRQARGNGPLNPTLKFETHQDSDDMDPYVCFRRREVRQTRKTRARDVQSADKLKRLRRELEDGRQLILQSYERELNKRDLLQYDRAVYETRENLKQLKVRLGIKTNENDLWPLKVSKRKAPEASSAQRAAAAGGAVRLGQPRPSSQAFEMDLAPLAAEKAQHDEELRRDIILKIQNHHNWNRNHVDLTKGPLPPVRSPSHQSSFRTAQAQYLLTPPTSSASHEDLEEPTPMDLDEPTPSAVFQFQGALIDENDPPKVAFRRRYGRLNRLWIDRRTVAKKISKDDHYPLGQASDQWKYDQDDSEDEQPIYEVDQFDTRSIRFRATIPLTFASGSGPQQQGAARPVTATQ
ncbi:hypothetical protein M406DRAFT_348512 [Cryphonectria parasitica EP155]|uniref:Enhancer of polycomb-like protein n=1 Tax=Cryphonectria parasitica (strain ATCC 38755 / EP155) TaxID=660469 RepID=A0A9P5CHK9_CRYP1|nr:uncharacterized protein M406DRAFT_348512 [Cryphonectria parasitica EP155]KAF3760204.1 hypothetical protein M406DRAFT_348512 [Cryphonectria parasitica EP155]